MNIPIVILHGWGASSQSFDKVKDLLTPRGHLVFIPDLPGFGNEPPPPTAWSVNDYADWVEKWINSYMSEMCDGRIVEKDKTSPQPSPYQGEGGFILFGHSFGGRIAIKIAARRPKGLEGLILCDAGGLTPRERIKRKAKIIVFGFLSKITKIVFSLPILKLFYGHLRKLGYFLAGSRDYYLLQNETMRETFKKVVAENLEPFLDEIKAPTLIIWGNKDKITPVSDAYLMLEHIKGSKLEILDGIGHSPHLESPNVLADKIEEFLQYTK